MAAPKIAFTQQTTSEVRPKAHPIAGAHEDFQPPAQSSEQMEFEADVGFICGNFTRAGRCEDPIEIANLLERALYCFQAIRRSGRMERELCGWKRDRIIEALVEARLAAQFAFDGQDQIRLLDALRAAQAFVAHCAREPQQRTLTSGQLHDLHGLVLIGHTTAQAACITAAIAERAKRRATLAFSENRR